MSEACDSCDSHMSHASHEQDSQDFETQSPSPTNYTVEPIQCTNQGIAFSLVSWMETKT